MFILRVKAATVLAHLSHLNSVHLCICLSICLLHGSPKWLILCWVGR